MTSNARDTLRRVFGYPEFRGDQAAIIDHVVAGRDCLVLMPTGAGKSLCYQVPALLRPGTAVVVSPLIALMQDQVDALAQLGVRAAFLNSSLSAEAAAAVEAQLLAGAYDLLYVAPERVLTARFQGLLERIEIALFAIDEAHCVSQWGHDFRREYRELNLLHERWPQVPRIALTATADEPTRHEIVERLGLHGARQFVSSFDRPNLRYHVVQKDNARRQLLDFLADHRGAAGIVYCLSRKKVDDTARFLSGEGLVALPYHAGMNADERSANQRRFLREDGVVMVATIAFGMGIDKPDVRFVAHLDLPKSLEGYYQETGRAGRDGDAADVWLAYGLGDAVTLRQMIESSDAGEQRRQLERRKLDQLLAYCESTRCRRRLLLANFGEDFPRDCGNCDNCLQPARTWDATVAAQKALSCVYRSGQRFGVLHLIDILRGVHNERIDRLGHDRLSTFGIGADIDVRQWKSLFRGLIALDALHADPQAHGGLRLTDGSRAVLRGDLPVILREESPRRQKRSPGASMTQVELSPADGSLFEALRAMRAALAREQGVPAYVIFHDATLRAIAAQRPKTVDALGQISGVGASKMERYGSDVLSVVRQRETA